jgi:hypothetical protein
LCTADQAEKACRAEHRESFKIYSPTNAFVSTVFVKSGDQMQPETQVLKMDTKNLEFELVKYQGEIEKRAIYSERLDPGYINDFVLTPMKQLQDMYAQSFTDVSLILEHQKAEAELGLAILSDLEIAQAVVDDTTAKQAAAAESILKKTAEIDAERSRIEAEINKLKQQIVLTEQQIRNATIKALNRGCVIMKTNCNVFVERGDLLFEVE